MIGKGAGAFVLLAVAAAALYAVLSSSCGERDPDGARADSVIADSLEFLETTEKENATVAALDSALSWQQRETDRVRDSARTAMKKGANLTKAAQLLDSAIALSNTTRDTIAHLTASRDMWRKSTLHYENEVVPLMLRQITSDSIWKLTAQAAMDTLEQQRNYARNRANAVTREFADYRLSVRQSESLDLGLFHLTGTAAKVVRCLPVSSGMAGAGAVIDGDDRIRGGLIGGGATMIGCLAG